MTNLIHRLCETTEIPIWQSGFYESVIRDEKSLHDRREYILQNPVRWFNNPEKMKQLLGARSLASYADAGVAPQKEIPILLNLRF